VTGELPLRITGAVAGPQVCCLCGAEPATVGLDGILLAASGPEALAAMIAHAQGCHGGHAAAVPGELPLRVVDSLGGRWIQCLCAAGMLPARAGRAACLSAGPLALSKMIAHGCTCQRGQNAARDAAAKLSRAGAQ
jgi:hypothetical protein